jgi:hypothetical protein
MPGGLRGTRPQSLDGNGRAPGVGDGAPAKGGFPAAPGRSAERTAAQAVVSGSAQLRAGSARSRADLPIIAAATVASWMWPAHGHNDLQLES